jgi:adenosylhomocysteine nucleosidase
MQMPAPGRRPIHDILYVMAVDAEYGPHLRARINPLMTGVGPIEAAIAITEALTRKADQGALPDLVVSLGSAGSRRLEQLGVYQASTVGYRDMDASALGFEKGRTPFLDHPAEIVLGPFVPGVARARLSTGGNVVSGFAYDAISADMVDMETFAVVRACQHFGVPLIALRGISDGAETLNHVNDWKQYLHIVDERLAQAVDRLEAAAREDRLEWPGSVPA